MALVQLARIVYLLHVRWAPLVSEGSLEQAKCVHFRTRGDANAASVGTLDPVGNHHWRIIGTERATANVHFGSGAAGPIGVEKQKLDPLARPAIRRGGRGN